MFIWNDNIYPLKKKKSDICIYFWLHWVFIAVCGLALVEARRGHFLLWYKGSSLRWLLWLQGTGSGYAGFISCGAQA